MKWTWTLANSPTAPAGSINTPASRPAVHGIVIAWRAWRIIPSCTKIVASSILFRISIGAQTMMRLPVLRTFKPVLYSLAVLMVVTAVPSTVTAQIEEAKKSHLLFDVQIDKLRDYFSSQGLDLSEMAMNSLRGDLPPEVVASMNRIYGTLQLPEDMATIQPLMMIMNGATGPIAEEGIEKAMPRDRDDKFDQVSYNRSTVQEMELPVNFFVRFEFGDASAAKQFAGTMWPTSNSREANGNTFYYVPDPNAPKNLAYWQPNETTVELGTTDYLTQESRRLFTDRLASTWGKMSDDAIRLAVDFESVSGMINELVEMGMENVPPAFSEQVALANSLSTLSLGLDMQSADLLTLKINCKDAAAAEQLNGLLGQQLNMAKVMAGGAIAEIPAEAPEMGVTANAIVASLNCSQSGTEVSMIIPRPDEMDKAVSKGLVVIQQRARVVARQNNVRQVALAVHNFHDSFEKFPFTDNENAGLSWRAHTSMFMFGPIATTTEPFDSPENQELADQMPEPLGADGKNTGICCIVHEGGGPRSINDITDGTSNTIMLIETPSSIPWMQPKDLTLDEAVALLSGIESNQSIVVAMFDGSVREITGPLAAETARGLLTFNGGEVVDNF